MPIDPGEIDAILADPRHIDNARARLTARQAERDMFREIAREIDGPPVTPVGMLLRALRGEAAADKPAGEAPLGTAQVDEDHCQQCGNTNPAQHLPDGYTACCAERVIYAGECDERCYHSE